MSRLKWIPAAAEAKDAGIRIFTIGYGLSAGQLCPDNPGITSSALLAAIATLSSANQTSCPDENADGDHYFCQAAGAEVTSVFTRAIQDVLHQSSTLFPLVSCAEGLAICDLRTRLMWEKKIEGGNDASCLDVVHGVGAICRWEEATGTWIDAINAENGTGYAGFNDWRVPSVQELVRIVDYGRAEPATAPAFEPTASRPYWSSTPRVDATEDVWGVDFISGIVQAFTKDTAQSVRAVRRMR